MRPDATTRTVPVRLAAMTLPIAGVLLMSVQPSAAQDARNAASNTGSTCAGDNGGITLSPGFCATVFADNVGHARHMVVAPNGVSMSTPGAAVITPTPRTPRRPTAASCWRCRTRPAAAAPTRSFASARVSRAAMPAGRESHSITARCSRRPTTVSSATPCRPARSRRPGRPRSSFRGCRSPATIPCIRSRSTGRAGCMSTSARPPMPASGRTEFRILRASSRARSSRRGPVSGAMTPTAPQFSPAERFATGLRNGEGLAFDSAGRIFATQHGRDQLRENWSALYTVEQGANGPAEELVQLERGADFGWPYCYFDLSQQKLVLAPEYGGDGKAVGPCAGKRAPVAAFPAHWAPNDLAIYDGQQFPAPYRGGAFIAFHGSWNRAPSPQGGYNVVFQPLADGRPSGNYVVFADGFAGASKEPGRAAHRPSGLAVGPDGALYVSDDQRARIWRIVFRGGTAVTAIAPAPAPAGGGTSTAAAGPPEGVHPDAGSQIAALPVPAGATPSDVHWAVGFTARAPAPAAMAPMPRARRWGRISPARNGCGAMAASNRSPRSSPTACRIRRSSEARCRRWAGPSSRRQRCRPSRTTSGRSAMGAAPPPVRRADE